MEDMTACRSSGHDKRARHDSTWSQSRLHSLQALSPRRNASSKRLPRRLPRQLARSTLPCRREPHCAEQSRAIQISRKTDPSRSGRSWSEAGSQVFHWQVCRRLAAVDVHLRSHFEASRFVHECPSRVIAVRRPGLGHHSVADAALVECWLMPIPASPLIGLTASTP